jgi:hypothetical protein
MLVNNIENGAGAFYMVKRGVSIIIFSSTNYVLKKFPAASSLYKPNMVIYSHIQTSTSANSEKVKVIGIAEFKNLLPLLFTIPYNAPLKHIAVACELLKCKYSEAWFKKESAFIDKKLHEFMDSKDPFELQKAIGNIKRTMN